MIPSYSYKDTYFNPRSREGSDLNNSLINFSIKDFNPRSREGSDAVGDSSLNLVEYFNPRSREGSDHIFRVNHKLSNLISIHAPARGATIKSLLQIAPYLIFQSTLPRGERRQILNNTVITTLFQSTLPRGERPGFDIYGNPSGIISIHAPARGATPAK